MSATPGTDHQRDAAKARPLDEWRKQAACAGLYEVMDRRQADGPAVRAALAVCRSCPVLDDCRAWVLGLPERLDPGGVCGGLTEIQRSKARRAATANRPRVCSECRVRKTRGDFSPSESSVSGLASECRACAARRKNKPKAARRG